ncbi:apoptosis antagonizing transcription factor [Naegleria gruberi]|uniref:Apoptosis antagonizing transcription factor n=1 Tax=Naegleria gruberi TaxID=5762 RepID=D2V2H3_NAEGR|nr:apoptosis antagonizing transcription factor [Naegleria gruberi]EFC48899.1 apoptosis antagonizing transcription factor [Naegleria gruberi]|eukprot:XP_002681643.1 apoptosis antagonizing transcription factor [Naegleria gruberi strain NEG-M]
MSSKLDLNLLTKKRKVEKPSSAAANSQDGERKKQLLQKLAQKYNKKDIDPENDTEFEDQDEKAKMDYDDDFEDGNRVSMLRSLDESLTKGAYKGHTIRKEDLFDDVDDMSALKDEDYLAEIKRLKQIDSDEEEGDDDEVDEEDEIMGQIKDIVEEDLYDSTDLETLKKTQQLEKQKAKSVLNQKLIYDHLLKLRILLQKPLSNCNRLPQNEMFWDFVEMTDDILPKEDKPQAVEKQDGETPSEPENIPTRLAELRKDTFHLIADMLSLQSSLFKKGMVEEKEIDGHYLQNVVSSEEGDLTEKVWKVLDESYKSYETFRNESVDRWATKTKIQSSVSGGSKLNLRNINAGVIDQVRNVLKNEKERKKLIGRTQVKQFEPSILGKRERDTKVDENGFEFDTEIYDDKDFYQVLLKDLISEVGSGTEVSFRKAITKKNTKGKYDGKTKGKAIKYTVHNELVNFMAPNFDNEIPESAQTLFGNLFGGDTVEFEEEEEEVDDATTTLTEDQDEDNESSSASSDEE